MCIRDRSWSNRQFDEINDGKKFPFRYDRRHDISLVGMYDLSKKINLAATWVYGTGNGVTLTNSSYGSPAGNVETFGPRNSYRMRPYHRLDVGINFVKKKTKYTRTWSVGALSLIHISEPTRPY